jgi:hypothetical protein
MKREKLVVQYLTMEAGWTYVMVINIDCSRYFSSLVPGEFDDPWKISFDFEEVDARAQGRNVG